MRRGRVKSKVETKINITTASEFQKVSAGGSECDRRLTGLGWGAQRSAERGVSFPDKILKFYLNHVQICGF